MLNIQAFNDTNGNCVEIDRRQVTEAFVWRSANRRDITIVYGPEAATATLGIGALGEVEQWLGRSLKVWSVHPMWTAPPKVPEAATVAEMQAAADYHHAVADQWQQMADRQRVAEQEGHVRRFPRTDGTDIVLDRRHVLDAGTAGTGSL